MRVLDPAPALVAATAGGTFSLACSDLLGLMGDGASSRLVRPDSPPLDEWRDKPGLTSLDTRLAWAEIVMAAALGGRGMVRREGGILDGRAEATTGSGALAYRRGFGSLRADMGASRRDLCGSLVVDDEVRTCALGLPMEPN